MGVRTGHLSGAEKGGHGDGQTTAEPISVLYLRILVHGSAGQRLTAVVLPGPGRPGVARRRRRSTLGADSAAGGGRS